jgi:hypothetical protein
VYPQSVEGPDEPGQARVCAVSGLESADGHEDLAMGIAAGSPCATDQANSFIIDGE